MKEIEYVTFVKDASIEYKAVEGSIAVLDTHEYDALLHLYVVYADGTDKEWSSDWNVTKEAWLHDAWDWAIEQGRLSGIYA